ncbi:hypothetical protein BU25DRAFT_414542 [Macroventuria anomochaeta]|uniref:Uncharacterized protein n=1 Tax=Macroventuria anomochaeta TaxID=301207 RepID=A0ACB6RQU9_9PLEO|nr:uncharacterized protein BU25DRAFT_414542 [Macroventuria anomochaeta]KAF2623289.1 hypothetical protein BU25DRAFT_414542 [Macroventuria anomochaeta]
MSNSESTESTPKIPPLPPPTTELSDTSSSSPVILPTPSVISEPDHISQDLNMDSSHDQVEAQKAEATPKAEPEAVVVLPPSPSAVTDGHTKTATTSTNKAKTERKTESKKRSKESKSKADDPSASESSDADSESEDSTEDEKEKRKRKRKEAAKKAAVKKKAAKEKVKKSKSKKKRKKADSSDDSSDDDTDDSAESESDSTSDSDSDDAKKKKKKKKKKSRRKDAKTKAKTKKKGMKAESSSDDSDSALSTSTSSSSSGDSDTDFDDVKSKRKRAKAKRKVKKPVNDDGSASESPVTVTTTDGSAPPIPGDDLDTQVTKVNAILNNLRMQQLAVANTAAAGITPPLPKSSAKKNAHEFKRIDQVWDTKLRDYKLIESTADQKDEFECVFTVRRRFNWEGKHRETLVDIKSKTLRGVLQVVLKECKSVSLVEDVPEIDPHILFHYYDEIKKYAKKTLKPKLKRAKKSKEKKKLTQEIAQCKLLLGYIDEDYAATRKALKPLLKAGTITYELCWALFKPNTIVYTPTYGNKEDPRCFRVEQCFEYESWLSGAKSCCIDGKYLEYDGQMFGLGDHEAEIKSFKGHKKITSLVAYPLKYHKDPKGTQKLLIERGKKFVALQGMSYRLQKGIAYQKVKNTIAKYNINGRVMVDPAIFRRIQPNYPLSYIKPDELNREDDEAGQEMSDDCCCSSDDDDVSDSEKPETDPMRVVLWKDSKGKKHPIKVLQSTIDAENGVGDNATTKLETDDDGNMVDHVFAEEELLIASPVVLGFAFSEKLWLEFSLSGIEEIQWNPEAFDSLVLPDKIKSNLKGLVSSHRFNAARTIDDVIQGKGKGLNVVLHGPPGVGKTLTGESIAEYLKCPLYAVSAGELGTNSGSLERDLNRIMDITHSWGAILLLDEADVFLEARQPHDIHRNSLVSVFLRLTEYYQGILFLTTNRVETFDEAFQSRIHMGIRYENLKPAARKKIWQHHVGKVEKMAVNENENGKGKQKVKPFTDSDFNELSKRNMNGRQIKNTVKTGQSIALSEKATFSMEHIKRVLEVAEAFEDDMRGGKGYRDAMQHYT